VGTQLVAASAAGVEGDPSRMLTHKARSTRSIYVEETSKAGLWLRPRSRSKMISGLASALGWRAASVYESNSRRSLVAPDSARSLREPLPRRTRVGQAGAALRAKRKDAHRGRRHREATRILGARSISILKVEVEGAEAVIFSENY